MLIFFFTFFMGVSKTWDVLSMLKASNVHIFFLSLLKLLGFLFHIRVLGTFVHRSSIFNFKLLVVALAALVQAWLVRCPHRVLSKSRLNFTVFLDSSQLLNAQAFVPSLVMSQRCVTNSQTKQPFPISTPGLSQGLEKYHVLDKLQGAAKPRSVSPLLRCETSASTGSSYPRKVRKTGICKQFASFSQPHPHLCGMCT